MGDGSHIGDACSYCSASASAELLHERAEELDRDPRAEPAEEWRDPRAELAAELVQTLRQPVPQRTDRSFMLTTLRDGRKEVEYACEPDSDDEIEVDEPPQIPVEE